LVKIKYIPLKPRNNHTVPPPPLFLSFFQENKVQLYILEPKGGKHGFFKKICLPAIHIENSRPQCEDVAASIPNISCAAKDIAV